MIEVVPAIIPQSFEDLKTKVVKVSEFVSNVQVDIMDGIYSPEPSFPFKGDGQLSSVNFSKEMRVGIRLDMMVENPEKYFDDWIAFGVSTFIIHFESTDKLDSLIRILRDKDKGVALAFKPSTPIEDIEPYVNEVDFLQIMGNDKIGFHGVSLEENVYGVIKELRKRYQNCIIGVDIGVNFETAPKLIAAGANKLVSGSTIYNHNDVSEAIQKLSLS